MSKRRRTPTPSWLSLSLLAAEASQVVLLRCAKLARGGPAARTEVRRMVSEKVSASVTEAGKLMSGGTLDASVQRVRKIVRANARRLSK